MINLISIINLEACKLYLGETHTWGVFISSTIDNVKCSLWVVLLILDLRIRYGSSGYQMLHVSLESWSHCINSYRRSPLSMIFGTWKKLLCEICTSWVVHTLNLTSTNLLITNSTSTNTYSTKNHASWICTSGDRTSGGPTCNVLL